MRALIPRFLLPFLSKLVDLMWKRGVNFTCRVSQLTHLPKSLRVLDIYLVEMRISPRDARPKQALLAVEVGGKRLKFILVQRKDGVWLYGFPSRRLGELLKSSGEERSNFRI